MGRVQVEQGDMTAALETYRTATELTPASISRLQKQGMLAFYMGEAAEATDALERTVRIGISSKMFDCQIAGAAGAAAPRHARHEGLRARLQPHRARRREAAGKRPPAALPRDCAHPAGADRAPGRQRDARGHRAGRADPRRGLRLRGGRQPAGRALAHERHRDPAARSRQLGDGPGTALLRLEGLDRHAVHGLCAAPALRGHRARRAPDDHHRRPRRP